MPAVPTDHWQNLQYASVRTSSLGPERSDSGPGRSIRSSDRTMLAPAALGRMRPSLTTAAASTSGPSVRGSTPGPAAA